MKAIIGGRLYNTETAERICTFLRKVNGPELRWMPGYCLRMPHEIDLYRTKKGAWFEHDVDAGAIKPVTAEAARDIIRGVDPERYMELFGPVPEA